MTIGVPTEVKNNESRVGLTPEAVAAYVAAGNTVLVQSGAGIKSGFTDDEYREAGATVVATAEEVFKGADMYIKVKEPYGDDLKYLEQYGRGKLLYTYLHLASGPALTRDLMRFGVTAVAYETVKDGNGRTPLLAPMSIVAGVLAADKAAYYLTAPAGGKGIAMGGVPGTNPAKVLIVGGGAVGLAAAQKAVGMGADVTILDVSPARVRYLNNFFNRPIARVLDASVNLDDLVAASDAVIGSVYIHGAKAPQLITQDAVARMAPGSVVVDVAIDQGGAMEGARATTHSDPVYTTTHGVIIYSVANMPGSVAQTSTLALNNSTLEYGLALAAGWQEAVAADAGLLKGLSVYDGNLVDPAVGSSIGEPVVPFVPSVVVDAPAPAPAISLTPDAQRAADRTLALAQSHPLFDGIIWNDLKPVLAAFYANPDAQEILERLYEDPIRLYEALEQATGRYDLSVNMADYLDARTVFSTDFAIPLYILAVSDNAALLDVVADNVEDAKEKQMSWRGFVWDTPAEAPNIELARVLLGIVPGLGLKPKAVDALFDAAPANTDVTVKPAPVPAPESSRLKDIYDKVYYSDGDYPNDYERYRALLRDVAARGTFVDYKLVTDLSKAVRDALGSTQLGVDEASLVFEVLGSVLDRDQALVLSTDIDDIRAQALEQLVVDYARRRAAEEAKVTAAKAEALLRAEEEIDRVERDLVERK
ncbi:alanine dehydrogenase [bacterium]|nr:alanine dehydrogenase [bacterium]